VTFRWLAASLLIGAASAAQSQPVRSVAKAIEVPRAVGRAVLTEELSPREVRRRALQAAMSDAVGQALGTRVASMLDLSTTERANTVEERFSRIIRETSSGIVTRYEILQDGWESPSGGAATNAPYVVAIKAWVREDLQRLPSAFRLEATANGNRFADRGTPERSDEVLLQVTASADAWITVFLVTADSVEVLFPNVYVPELRVRQGVPLEVPSVAQRAQLGLRLRATLPSDTPSTTERITVVATTVPVPFEGTPRRTGTDGARVPTIRDTFEALAKWVLAIPSNERAVADLTYEIVRVEPGSPTPPRHE